ncbi:MAG: class I SAM-dependent methyltransferase [Candidatus Nanohalobium sp.]
MKDGNSEDHVIDAEKADKLEDEGRYRILSREELLAEVKHGDTVVDIGSGTGFFTDDIAEKAGKVYAVDFQKGMHDYYREKGVPENVELIHSKASEIEVENTDMVVSILSLHEIDFEKSLEKFSELLEGGGKLLIVDWSADAETDDIPPRDKLYTAEKASEKVSELFEVESSEERSDTFKLKAVKKK